MEYTRQYVQIPRKVRTVSLFYLEKGQISKSNWLWFLKSKMVELSHGNMWLDKILSKMQRQCLLWKKGWGASNQSIDCVTQGFECGHMPYWSLVVWGMSKNLKQIRQLYRFCIQIFFPIHATFFFLKNVQYMKPKTHNTFLKILTKFLVLLHTCLHFLCT